MSDLGLAHKNGRCASGFAPVQHPAFCPCAGLAAKAKGQAQVAAAKPADVAKVEAVIRRFAALGEPFSANQIRDLHGVKGGAVGKAFTNMRNAKLIRSCGDDTSTSEATHGHRIFRWVGTQAVAA